MQGAKESSIQHTVDSSKIMMLHSTMIIIPSKFGLKSSIDQLNSKCTDKLEILSLNGRSINLFFIQSVDQSMFFSL